MLDVSSFWDLIEQRARTPPEARMAVDETGRVMTFAQYRDDAERAAAGLQEMGIDKGTVVSWQLPTWLESFVLCAALSRLESIQNPILPIYRERKVGFIARQAKTKLLSVPSGWRNFDFQGRSRRIAATTDGVEDMVRDKKLPSADPRASPGGGAPKPPQLHYDMRKEMGAPIVSGYGLTESPILTMASTDDADEALATTEGRAMRGVDLRVVTLEGKLAGIGEEGEIRAKAPQLMRGYLDMALDKDAFDEDGYFRTGDLGKLDADGNVTITGRLKDIIIRKGENISAKEVEDLLFQHPRVADVAVIGLPDPASGEIACAVVALKEGGTLTLLEVADFLKEKGLRNQAIPERVEVVSTLPRNPAGKVLKQDLKKQFS